MKIERTRPEDAQAERKIVTAMIMSGRCIRAFRNQDCNRFFQTRFARIIADWCFKYFEKYETAPKSQIANIFEVESDYLEQDVADMVERYLESLSQEFENTNHFNAQYWIDYSEEYFRNRSYKELAKEISKAADSGDAKKAEEVYAGFKHVQVAMPEGVDVFDQDHITDHRLAVEEDKGAYLFKMPGALGELLGDIERDTFFGFLSREKAGKSWLLMELGFRGVREGCNVVSFDVGDMTERQSDNRYYSYLTSKPFKDRYEGRYWKPVLDCLWNQEGSCDEGCSDNVVKYDDKDRPYFNKMYKEARDHVPCTKCKGTKRFRGSVWWKKERLKKWTWKEVREKTAWFEHRFRKGSFRRVNRPMSSTRASDIESWILLNHDRTGIIPDVVLIDYADILLPENGRVEFRHQENEKWRMLRRISQKYHCAVITATQSDAAGYKKRSLDLMNFSEDKRKYGHVTHFYAINKTKTEEDHGISRIGALLLREDEMAIIREVTLLQALRKGRPYVASFFGSYPKIS